MIYRAGKRVRITGIGLPSFMLMLVLIISALLYINKSGINNDSYIEYSESTVSKNSADTNDIGELKLNRNGKEIVAYINNSEQPIIENYKDYKNILGIKDNDKQIGSNIKEYESKYLKGIKHSRFEDIEYTINYMHSLNGKELVEYKCSKEYGVRFEGGGTGIKIGYNGCLSDMPGKIEVYANGINSDCNKFKDIAHILSRNIINKNKINYLLHSKNTEIKHNKNTNYNIYDKEESSNGLLVKAYREVRSINKDGDKDNIKLPSGVIKLEVRPVECAGYVDKANYVSIFNILKGNKSSIRLDKLTNNLSLDKSIIQVGEMMDKLDINELAEIKPGNMRYTKETDGDDIKETLSLQIDAFEYDGYDYSDIFYLDIVCRNGELESGGIKYRYFISNVIQAVSNEEKEQAEKNCEKIIKAMFNSVDRAEFLGKGCKLDTNIGIHNGEYYKYGLIEFNIAG